MPLALMLPPLGAQEENTHDIDGVLAVVKSG